MRREFDLTSQTSLRERLRLATSEIHARLHRHEGLGAVAAGTISRADYTKLLARLWGFHRAFATVLANPPDGLAFDASGRARVAMIEADLMALGLDRAAIDDLPVCDFLFRPGDAGAFMGALYVVEGSTMGGAQLARAVAGALGGEGDAGRRFFLGYGARHGVMWRDFLDHLDRLGADEAQSEAALRGALATFDDFERWVAGWENPGPRDMEGARPEHRVPALG